MDFLSRFLRKSPARELTESDNNKNTPASPAIADGTLKTNSGAAPRERKVKTSEDSDSSLDYGSASDTENIAHENNSTSPIKISEAGRKLFKSFLSTASTCDSPDTSATSIYEDTENIDPSFAFEPPKPKVYNDLTESFESPDVTLLTSPSSTLTFKDCLSPNESNISLGSCERTLVENKVVSADHVEEFVNNVIVNDKSLKANGISNSVAEDIGITETNTLKVQFTDVAAEAISELETVLETTVNGTYTDYNLDATYNTSFSKIYSSLIADDTELNSTDPLLKSHIDVGDIKFESILLPDKSGIDQIDKSCNGSVLLCDPIAFDLKSGEINTSLCNQVTEDPLHKTLNFTYDFLNVSDTITQDIEESTLEITKNGGGDTVILNESTVLCESLKNIANNTLNYNNDRTLIQCGDINIQNSVKDLTFNTSNFISGSSIINSTGLDETITNDLSLIKSDEINNLDSTLVLLNSIESIIEDNSNYSKLSIKCPANINVSEYNLDVDDLYNDSLSNISSALPSLKSSTDSIGVLESRESSVPPNYSNLPIEFDLESNQDFVCGSIDSIGICTELSYACDTFKTKTLTNGSNLHSTDELEVLLNEQNDQLPTHINTDSNNTVVTDKTELKEIADDFKPLNGDEEDFIKTKLNEVSIVKLDSKSYETEEKIQQVQVLSSESANHTDPKTDFPDTSNDCCIQDHVILENSFNNLAETQEVNTDIEQLLIDQTSNKNSIENVVISDYLIEESSQSEINQLFANIKQSNDASFSESKSSELTGINLEKSFHEYKESPLKAISTDEITSDRLLGLTKTLNQSYEVLENVEHLKPNNVCSLENEVLGIRKLENNGNLIHNIKDLMNVIKSDLLHVEIENKSISEANTSAIEQILPIERFNSESSVQVTLSDSADVDNLSKPTFHLQERLEHVDVANSESKSHADVKQTPLIERLGFDLSSVESDEKEIIAKSTLLFQVRVESDKSPISVINNTVEIIETESALCGSVESKTLENISKTKVESTIIKNSDTSLHITDSGTCEVNFPDEEYPNLTTKINDIKESHDNKNSLDNIDINTESQIVTICSDISSGVKTVVEDTINTVIISELSNILENIVETGVKDSCKDSSEKISELKASGTLTTLDSLNIDKENSLNVSFVLMEEGVESNKTLDTLKPDKRDSSIVSSIILDNETKPNKEIETKYCEINVSNIDTRDNLISSSSIPEEKTESNPRDHSEISPLEKESIHQETNLIVSSLCDTSILNSCMYVAPTESNNILQENKISPNHITESDVTDNCTSRSVNESFRVPSNNNIAAIDTCSVNSISENLLTNMDNDSSASKISETPVKGLREKKKNNLNFQKVCVEFEQISDPFKSSNKMRLSPPPGICNNVESDTVKSIPEKQNETIVLDSHNGPVDNSVLNTDATYGVHADSISNGNPFGVDYGLHGNSASNDNHIDKNHNTTHTVSIQNLRSVIKESTAVQDHVFVKPMAVAIAPMGMTVSRNNDSVDPYLTPPTSSILATTVLQDRHFTNEGDLMGMSPCKSVSSNGAITAEPIHDVFSPPNMCDDFMDVDEDIPSEQLFSDPAAIEYLLNRGGSTPTDLQKRRDLSKDSLFVKFDPLVSAATHSSGIISKLPAGLRTPRDLEHSGGGDENSGSSGLAESCSSDSSTSAAVMNKTIQSGMMSTGSEQALLNLSIKDPPHHVPVEKPTQVVSPAINWSQSQAASQLPPKTPPTNTQRRDSVCSPALTAMERLLSLSPATPTPLPPPPPPPQERTVMDPDVYSELVRVKELWTAEVSSSLARKTELETRLAETERRLAETEDREKGNNHRLKEVTRQKNQLSLVVQEYERSIASLTHEREALRRQWEAERFALVKERDEATAHLAGVEHSFNDVHAKYERSKAHIADYRSNADALRRAHSQMEDSLHKQEARYDALRQHAMQQIDKLNQEGEVMKRAHDLEVAKLMALLKKSELTVDTLQENIAQKNKENDHLTDICNGLIQKMSN